jgi:hypothetical protein
MRLYVLRNDELYSWVTNNNVQNLIPKKEKRKKTYYCASEITKEL